MLKGNTVLTQLFAQPNCHHCTACYAMISTGSAQATCCLAHLVLELRLLIALLPKTIPCCCDCTVGPEVDDQVWGRQALIRAFAPADIHACCALGCTVCHTRVGVAVHHQSAA